jgi:hypothetical protein
MILSVRRALSIRRLLSVTNKCARILSGSHPGQVRHTAPAPTASVGRYCIRGRCSARQSVGQMLVAARNLCVSTKPFAPDWRRSRILSRDDATRPVATMCDLIFPGVFECHPTSLPLWSSTSRRLSHAPRLFPALRWTAEAGVETDPVRHQSTWRYQLTLRDLP